MGVSPGIRGGVLKPGVKKTLWSTASIIASFPLLAIGLCGVLISGTLFTEFGSRRVLEYAAQYYADIIPGDLTIDKIQGTVGFGLRMNQITLADRKTRPLVTADELSLCIDWSALLTPRLAVPALHLSDIAVHVRDDDTAGFADLAPISDETDVPSNEPFMLPFEMGGRLQADRFVLHTNANNTPPVSVRRLDVRIDAAEDWVSASNLRVSGKVAALGDTPLRIGADAALQKGVVTAQKLAVLHDTAHLFAPRLSYDLNTDKMSAKLGVRGSHFQLSQLSGVQFTEDPTAQIDLEGTLQSLRGTVTVQADQNSRFTTDITGALWPNPDFQMDFSVAGVPNITPLDTLPKVNGKGTLTVKGHDFQMAAIDGDFTCESCMLPGIGAVDLALSAHLKKGTGTLHTQVSAPFAQVEGDADVVDFMPESITFSGGIDDMGALSNLIKTDLFNGAQGAVTLSGTCNGPKNTFVCRGDVEGNRLRVQTNRIRKMTAAVQIHPLNPQLPFEGTVTVSGAAVSGIHINKALIEATGNRLQIAARTKIRFKRKGFFDGDIKTTLTPNLDVSISRFRGAYKGLKAHLLQPVRITLDQKKVTVDKLALRVANGEIRLEGVLDLNGKSSITASIENVHLNRLSHLIPQITPKGILSTKITLNGMPDTLTGTAKATGKKLSINHIDLGSLYANADLSPKLVKGWVETDGHAGKTAAGFSVPLALNIKEMKASLLPKTLFVDGKLAAFDLRLIKTVMPKMDIAGTATIHVRSQGSLLAPDLSIKGRIDKASWQTQPIGNLALNGSYRNDRVKATVDLEGYAVKQAHVSVDVPLSLAAFKPVWHPHARHQAIIKMKEADLGFVSVIRALLGVEGSKIPRLDGTLEVESKFAGTLSNPTVDLFIGVDDLKVDDAFLGRAATRLGIESHIVDLHTQVMTNPNRYVDLKATVPFEVTPSPFEILPISRAHHHIQLRFAGLDSKLFGLFKTLPKRLDFRLTGFLEGEGQINNFDVTAEVKGDAAYGRYGPLRVTSRMRLDPSSQAAIVTLGPKYKPSVQVEVNGALPADPEQLAELNPKDIPINGRVVVPGFDMRRLTGYLPKSMHRLEGRLKGSVTISGTVGAPKLAGGYILDKGAVTIAPLNQRLRDMSMHLWITEKRVSVSDFTFKSGRGNGFGAYEITRDKNGISGKGRIAFKKFPFVRPGLPEALFSGEVHPTLFVDKQGTDLLVAVKNTNIHVMNTSGATAPKDIREDNRIVWAMPNKDETANETQDDRKAEKPFSMTVDITNPVELRGQGVEMVWAGKVQVKTTNSDNRVKGAIALKPPGRLRMLGNVFDVTSGSITFPPSGALDPFVNLTATVSTEESLVTATVRGRATKPDLVLTSDPPMTQYQIFALLVTGKSDTTEESDEELDIPAQAASLLLSFNNPELERQLYQKLGIDRIALSMGSTVSEPILVIGKRIGRRVYIESEYHHNAPETENRATGRIEYRIAPGWTLETEYGDAQKGEVGVYWQKRFDGEDESE